MNKDRKLIIAGNWKMNKTVAEALALVNDLKRELANVKEVDIVVCPPFTALSEVSKAILDSNLRIGAQNMSENGYGAFTGEIAAGTRDAPSLAISVEPNPSREDFRLHCEGPARGAVRGSIHDVLGRRVATLIESEAAVLPQDAHWTTRDASGREVPPGLYFARLEAGTRSTMAKLIVTR